MSFVETEHQPMSFRLRASNRNSNLLIPTSDVTDNKTKDLLSICKFTVPIYRMNDKFHREDERLKTFDHWPLEWMDKKLLAQTGMFYTGDHDKVKCYFCEVEIGCWETTDLPISEHLRWSSNCPLLRRRTTNNVPIDAEALNLVLPTVGYDICGANDQPTDVRPNSYPEGTIVNYAGMESTAASVNPQDCMNIAPTSYFPEYPEYAVESARLRSYNMWPRNMKQRPEQLAEAGFFYTGVGDRVKCFSCGGGLMDWDDNDDPWEQHAMWLRKCRFLKLMKGQNYIDGIVAKQKAKATGEETEKSVPEVNVTTSKSLAIRHCDGRTEHNSHAIQGAATPTATKSTTAAPPAMCSSTVTTATAGVSQGAAQSSNGKAEDNADPEMLFASSAIVDKKSNSSIPEEKLCKICYAGEYNTAFLPCGHVVACAKCASSVTKCPLCRKPFIDVMRVYFS